MSERDRKAKLAMQDKISGLEQLSRKLVSETNSERLVMKLGSEKYIAYDSEPGKNNNSQAFPALSVHPVDVS